MKLGAECVYKNSTKASSLYTSHIIINIFIKINQSTFTKLEIQKNTAYYSRTGQIPKCRHGAFLFF